MPLPALGPVGGAFAGGGSGTVWSSSRTISNQEVVYFEEEKISLDVANGLYVYPTGVNSGVWNAICPAAALTGHTNLSFSRITCKYTLKIASAIEEYGFDTSEYAAHTAEDIVYEQTMEWSFEAPKRGAIAADSWTYTQTDSGNVLGLTLPANNSLSLTVSAERMGMIHSVKNARFMGKSCPFNTYAFNHSEFHSYTNPVSHAVTSGVAGCSVSATSSEMRAETTTMIGRFLPPSFTVAMTQLLTSEQQWRVQFKPSDESGAIVPLSTTIKFQGGVVEHVETRTAPVDEVFYFPSKAFSRTLTTTRTQVIATGTTFGTVDAGPDANWNANHPSGTTVVDAKSACLATKVRVTVPAIYQDAPGTTFTNPNTYEKFRWNFVGHRFHDAAESNWCHVANVQLANPKSLPAITWALASDIQPSPPSGASASGTTLTAGSDLTWFKGTLASTAKVWPYRVMNLHCSSSGSTTLTVAVRLPGHTISLPLTSVGGGYTKTIASGSNDARIDLCYPDVGYTGVLPRYQVMSTYNRAIPDTQSFIGREGPASMDMVYIGVPAGVTLSSVALTLIVANEANLRVVGSCPYNVGINADVETNATGPFYGSVDAADAWRVKNAGDNNRLSPGICLDYLRDNQQVTITSRSTGDVIPWIPGADIDNSGYYSSQFDAYDSSGDRLPSIDMVAGGELTMSMQAWGVSGYAGIRNDAMLGGSVPFLVRCEMMVGGVASTYVVPPLVTQIKIDGPAGETKISNTQSDGYRSIPFTGLLRSRTTKGTISAPGLIDLYSDPTIKGEFVWDTNRVVIPWISESVGAAGEKNPYHYHDAQGRLWVVSLSSDNNVRVRRGTDETWLPNWVVETTATATGDCSSPTIYADPQSHRATILFNRGSSSYYATSDDDGESWSGPTLITTNAMRPIGDTHRGSGHSVEAHFVPDSGTTGPGTIKARYRSVGATSWGAWTTVKDNTGSNLRVASDGWGSIRFSESGAETITITIIKEGESDPSEWQCTHEDRLDFIRVS